MKNLVFDSFAFITLFKQETGYDLVKNLLTEKITSFKNYIYEIVPENHKEKLNSDLKNIENDYFTIILFVIMIKKENIDKNICEFMKKYDINDEYK